MHPEHKGPSGLVLHAKRGHAARAEPWSSALLRVTGGLNAAFVAIGWSRSTNPLPLELDLRCASFASFPTVTALW